MFAVSRCAIWILYGFAWLDILVWLGLVMIADELGMRNLLFVWYPLAVFAVFWCLFVPARVPQLWRTFVARFSLFCSIQTLFLTIFGSACYALAKRGIEIQPLAFLGVPMMFIALLLSAWLAWHGARKAPATKEVEGML